MLATFPLNLDFVQEYKVDNYDYDYNSYLKVGIIVGKLVKCEIIQDKVFKE